MPIAWHQENLRNMEAGEARLTAEIERLQARRTELTHCIIQRRAQIARATKEGRDGFDWAFSGGTERYQSRIAELEAARLGAVDGQRDAFTIFESQAETLMEMLEGRGLLAHIPKDLWGDVYCEIVDLLGK